MALQSLAVNTLEAELSAKLKLAESKIAVRDIERESLRAREAQEPLLMENPRM